MCVKRRFELAILLLGSNLGALLQQQEVVKATIIDVWGREIAP